MIQPTGGRFSYAYDPVGRITTLTNHEGQVTTWSYDAASRVTAILLANGARSTYVYDNADRVLQLNNSIQSGSQVFFWTFTYTYDAANQLATA